MKKLCILCIVIPLFFGCNANPISGKKTIALADNSLLFPLSFSQYSEFLSENTVITDTAEAEMVYAVGEKLAQAARKWLAAEGHPNYLDDYRWEYKLVSDDAANAWCMPGGKIVVYTGILPVTQTEQGLAVVLGHEVAHALLNHGQQRMSVNVLRQLGAVGLSLVTADRSAEIRELVMVAYGAGSTLLGTLPFSRSHENESDRYGLMLMAIAGFNPDEAAPFWERMAAMDGEGGFEFFSTHPSNAARIKKLRDRATEAKQKAAEFGVEF